LPPQKTACNSARVDRPIKINGNCAAASADAATKVKRHFRRSLRTSAAGVRAGFPPGKSYCRSCWELEQVLNRYSHSILKAEDWLDLDQLLNFGLKQQDPHHCQIIAMLTRASSQHDNQVDAVPESFQPPAILLIAGNILGILLLSAPIKVELHQEEFYKEIKIQALPRSTSSDRSQSVLMTKLLPVLPLRLQL